MSDYFFSGNTSTEEKEIKLVEANRVPDPFHYVGAYDIKNLAIDYTPQSGGKTSLLLEDVVVEYKPYYGQDKKFKDFSVTYLKTYVSVGIPADRYEWIFHKALELEKELQWKCNYANDGYIWVTAQIPPDDTVYEEVTCYTYSKENGGKTIPVGSLYDVLTRVKSNIRGYGQFTVRVLKNFEKKPLLSFLLTGFQMTNLTEKQSYPRPFVVHEPSFSLSNSLSTLNLNKE